MTLPILEAKLSSPSSLEAEFDSVPTNQAFPDELPPHVDDRNRDPNILPNIHSRVFLSVDQNSSRAETDEYINANFLRGYRGQDQAYIVTQAPSPPTVEPFWRMVWDQNVEVIVQLNGLVENGKLVGTRYWPTKSQWHTVIAYTNDGPSQKKTSVLTIGDFRIKLKSEKVFKNVVLTTLRVSRPGGSSRIVKHFWYLGLHPLKLPKSADDLHSFVADVRLQRRSRNPMVIHCVTGIERSSLFVGLDMIQNVMAAGQRVDILHILCQMRQDRGMLLDSVVKNLLNQL